MKLAVRTGTHWIWLATLLCLSAILASCGDGGGTSSGGGSGSSTVAGTITEFSGGQAFFMPSDPPSDFAGVVAKELMDAIIRPAWAQFGAGVSVGGCDTTASATGQFRCTGVAAGRQLLTLSLGGESFSQPIDVPANSVVTLLVAVTNGSMVIDGMSVSMNDDGSSDGLSDDGSSDGLSDDDSSSDGLSDDDSSSDGLSDDDSSSGGNSGSG